MTASARDRFTHLGVPPRPLRRGLALGFLLLAFAVPAAQASTTYVPAGHVEGFGFPLGGVAADNTSGDVYVVDGKNAVVDKYDAAGTPISHFGEPCSEAPPAPCGAGQFGQSFFVGASGIAVDQTTGDVYVTDNVNNRVEKFNSAGTYLSQFDGSATPAGNFSTPTSVAVDPTDGSVYVVDAGNGVVDKFDSLGAMVTGFGTGGSIGGFSFPTFGSQPAGGVAVDSSGRLYVGDPGNGVVDEFDSSGALQGQLGAGTLSAPSELAVDSADNVFAVDSSSQSVVEFDSSGNQLLSFPDGVSSTPRGIAVAGDGSHLYLSTTAFFGSSEVLTFARATVPDVTTAAASNRQQTTATLNGTVNPDGVALTDCHFVYTDEADFLANGYTGPDAQTASCVPDATSIPADHSDHGVTANLIGLSPNTTYDFRLLAANAGGSGHGQDLTFRTPGPPVIDSTSVASVTSADAILEAQVNPEGAGTTYHFEYGTTTKYGAVAPVPDGDLGTGSMDRLASTPIRALAAGTTYHFRIVATNASSPAGGTLGPDQTFTTYPPAATGLPDGRAYELVTPSDKLGNDVGQVPLIAAVAADGQHVYYKTVTLGAFGEPANGLYGTYLATRAPGGWSSTSLTPPAAQHPVLTEGAVAYGASADFSTLIMLIPNAIDPNDQDGGALDLYARSPAGAFTWISQNEAANPLTPGARADDYLGSSADASHVLYETRPPDWGFVGGSHESDGSRTLYEWTDGTTRLVGVNSDGSLTSACGAVAGATDSGHSGTPGSGETTIDRAISSDGSHIFFESPDPSGAGDPSCSPQNGGTQPVELYLRQSAATTTEISLSQRAGSLGTPAPGGAEFVGASVDGSRVFFTSPDQLTDDAPPTNPLCLAAAACDLYQYEVGSGVLTFIATGRPLTASQIPAISADGSHLYFIGEAPGGPSGQPGLYLWNEGRISYISPAPVGEVGPASVEAEASSDGSTLAFTSTGDLTGFEAHGHREVYVYTAPSGGGGSLACASCELNGVAPIGDAALALHNLGLANSNRAITADGGQVFFSSPDPLLPPATNGLRNVYEYERGTLHLLSNGNGPYETRLLGASSDGNDVIIATRDSLVPQDTDNGGSDLYDVRVGGGFPPPSAPPQCSGEGCQGEPTGAPAGATLGSSAFSGPGNQKPIPLNCKKGFVKKHGSCVKKRHARKSNHAKAHRSARHANTSRRASR